MYLPPNVTSLIQPMDQGVIEATKRLYRNSLLRELRLKNDEESVLSQLKKLTIKDCSYRIAHAWELLPQKNLQNAWNKILKNKIWNEDTQARYAEVVEMLHLIREIPGFRSCNYDQAKLWIEEDQRECGWRTYDATEILERC